MRTLFLAFMLMACSTPGPSRLPDPTRNIKNPPQWTEYCQREGQEDPACP